MVRLPHPQNGDSQGHETLLAPSAYKQTGNYDIEGSNHQPPINAKVKRIERLQDEMVSYIHNFTSKRHSQTSPCTQLR